MNFHSFRAILCLICLICLLYLITWPGASSARATSHVSDSQHVFQPSGHGTVTPTMVDTTTMPQVLSEKAPQSQPVFPAGRTAQTTPRNLAALQNVVNVPAPTSTDPTASVGLTVTSQPKP